MLRRRREPTVALAGAGSIAVVHALAAPLAGLRVHAVASAGGTSARHLAGELDARRVRPDDLPAGADLLVVATPPTSHAHLALQGLAAGAAVLVEKPVTTTLEEADRLVEAAAARGAVLRVAENLLAAPGWREVRRRRPAATPTHLSARAVQPPPDWGHFREALGAGGVLFDLGPHPLALVLELAGSPPVGVAAALHSGRHDGADDRAQVSVRFADDLTAGVEVSWSADDAEWSLQAAWPDGVVRWELVPRVALEIDGDPVPLPPAPGDIPDARLAELGYVQQLRDVVAEPAIGQTAEQARSVLEVICAAYASAGADGAEVPLPFTGDRSATPMQLWRG
jgi:predicted dehydrogenase